MEFCHNSATFGWQYKTKGHFALWPYPLFDERLFAMSEDIEQGNLTAEPAQSIAEAAGEITAFLKALEDQIAFLKTLVCVEKLDEQGHDKEMAMAWSASWTASSPS